METIARKQSPLSITLPAKAQEPRVSFSGTTTAITDFAAAELRRFMRQTPHFDDLREIQFAIHPEGRDAFEFRLLDGHRLLAIAANDRSCLYAAYAILEALGWRFAVPGEDHFDASLRKPYAWKELTGKTVAAFEWRGLSASCPSNDEIATVIDWMPKARLNSLLIGHNGNIEQSLALMPLLKQRGIRLDTGGHILKDFLPVELFNEHPEYFRMKEGARRADGNFCVSHPDTLRIIAENAVHYARRLPDARVFHFWGDDVEGGSWCDCPDCARHSPGEQMMSAINAAAAALKKERPSAIVDYILYHDTLEIVDPLKPADNTFAFYAPRERCYAHALGEASCARNRWYADCLERARALFGRRIKVFEYYNTFMLWRCLGVAMPQTIVEDLRYYKSRGVEDIQTLQFAGITNWAYPLNTYAFARAAWDADLSRDQIVAEFVQGRYGHRGREMARVIDLLEQATIKTITYCGYEKHAYDLRDVPLAPAEFAAQHRRLVAQAIALTESAMEHLPADEPGALAADRIMLELNRDNLRALLHQMNNEFDSATELLLDLKRRMSEQADLIGGWSEAPHQFQMIADLMQSAKAGRRHRNW